MLREAACSMAAAMRACLPYAPQNHTSTMACKAHA